MLIFLSMREHNRSVLHAHVLGFIVMFPNYNGLTSLHRMDGYPFWRMFRKPLFLYNSFHVCFRNMENSICCFLIVMLFMHTQMCPATYFQCQISCWYFGKRQLQLLKVYSCSVSFQFFLNIFGRRGAGEWETEAFIFCQTTDEWSRHDVFRGLTWILALSLSLIWWKFTLAE